MYLSDSDLKSFFGYLNGLRKDEAIALRRSIGQQFNSAPMKTRMALLSYLPDRDISPDTMQDLFFVAGMYCKKSPDPTGTDSSSSFEGFKRIEDEIATILSGGTYEKSSAGRKMQDILGARTGQYGTLYRMLATLLAKSTTKIDCLRLARDLENWDDPAQTVQMRWATAYAKKSRPYGDG